ncbi:AlkZ-related protein [Alkaliphilus peptidifermentans]|uniref:Uncharacterized protein n=1 Tax=Alkaliphilus peptidifermentans DSM 18978 TaxID=1120976 RepID=A0A1G5BN43_9FIRM|nr:hypothetical protein [Alkaliphilus peptidifermentans]SCX91598.1 hypothetical protein SAMN03080606_00471 [Alkaliphilus peptidifermentans DSM 18978]
MNKDYISTRISEYSEFISMVKDIGFMTLSNNRIDFPCLSDLTNQEEWHTGLSTDPWLWRVSIEKDRKAAYGKLFDKKPGFISLEWYPKFLAAKRSGRNFSEIYSAGLISNYAKQIYDLFEDDTILAVHEIKSLGGFTKDLNSKYEAAMCELQMWMFITVKGSKQKISAKGEPYGWPSTAYSTVEAWAGDKIMEESNNIKPKDAMEEIFQRIREISPDIEPKKIKRFLNF